MTFTSPAADNPPRRSSRRREPRNDQYTSHSLAKSSMAGRVTRSSVRLSARDRHDEDDRNGVAESHDLPAQLSTSNNALKRTRPNDQDAQPSPKSRRKLEPDQQGDHVTTPAEGTHLSAGPGKVDTEHRIAHTGGATSQNHGRVTAKLLPAFEPKMRTRSGWESLEYSILVQIFDYLHHDPGRKRQTNHYLLRVAAVCKAFSEPALTALHKYPFLCSPNMMVKFADHVSITSSHNWCNYRQKVEILVVDVAIVAQGAVRGRIGNIVNSCPRLTHIKIHHWMDGKPYRQLEHSIRWTYPDELILALGMKHGQVSTKRLKTWWWSKRMIDSEEIPDLREAHLRPSFQSLLKIGFVNFQVPSMSSVRSSKNRNPDADTEDQMYIEQMAGTLAVLPQLRHLVMESCTIVDGRFLSLLPTTIRHLELINCWDVTAVHLSSFLSSHGGQLEQLTLKHNQSLSISFLPNLSRDCPNLRALRMNFTYFKFHEFYNDCQPFYDYLLEEDEVPTWPRSLEVIELEHLRDWMLPAAKNFFQSLADNAPLLVNLRRLVIKATLNIPWRERCAFRDHWAMKLRDLFARKQQSSPPVDSLSVASPSREQEAPARRRRGIATPTRRSTRTAGMRSTETPSRRNGPARDLRTQTRPSSYRDPDTDDDASISESMSETMSVSEQSSPVSEDNVTSLPFIEGTCEVVEIRIDNQKPTETQYGMDDFLDGDGEDDEPNNYDNDEWVSDVSDEEEYAW